MEERKLAWWQRPIVRIGIAIGLLVILGGAVGGVYYTQTPPEQPIAFPHSTHVGIGAQCLYCHPGAATGPVAGLPPTELCWGCHQQIQRQTPELDKLASFARSNEQIPWVPVAEEPDFVHFNHRPHIAAGLNCEDCHGDVGNMQVAEPQAGQNMGWCLSCHQEMAPEQWTRLSDCSLCHY
ncbi:MAG: cytochrome c3 family protein [Chloroflexi bacterium]|jgi:hypothetical protein|nr:cytochrome c3 family protein [Anaerolineaceae bacterium]NMB86890.1 cytochrome c3 family protein [Chloroflexota bacterium]